MSDEKSRYGIVLDAGVVAFVVALIAVWFYWGNFASGTPIAYDGDALATLARIQGYASGETAFLAPGYVDRLNAPFVAAWSDFPSEDLSYYLPALFVKGLGLVLGTSVFVILLHVAAGICFLIAARLLNIARIPAIGFAILYGLATYGFQRNLNHLNLLVYGYIPLLVVVLIWLWERKPVLVTRCGVVFTLGISFVAGLGNPYYLSWYLGFVMVLLVPLLFDKKWTLAAVSAGIFAAAVSGFFIQNLDTFRFLLEHGANPSAVRRDYWGLIQFGLTLPDLVFPNAHGWTWFQDFSRSTYQTRIPERILGESQMAYLGLVGIFAMTWLLFDGVWQIATRHAERISPFFWIVAGIFFFALVGGANYLLGAFEFVLLRAGNRFSIVLLAVVLLFLAGKLGQGLRPVFQLIVVGLLTVVGLWDQLPSWPTWEQSRRANATEDFLADQIFARDLEAGLPEGAMIFQLPVKSFPESHVIHRMGDYEHFRPYLHTSKLRFSYGTIRGRGDTEWQARLASLPPDQMIAELERYGFSALLINRRAYEDDGQRLLEALEKQGMTPWLESRDLVALRLSPSMHPDLPPLASQFMMRFGQGFYPEEKDLERTWRWAKESAFLKIIPAYQPPGYRLPEGGRKLRFFVQTAIEGTEVRVQDETGEIKVIVAPPQRSAWVDLPISKNGTKLQFSASDKQLGSAENPGELSFRIIDPIILSTEPAAR